MNTTYSLFELMHCKDFFHKLLVTPMNRRTEVYDEI